MNLSRLRYRSPRSHQEGGDLHTPSDVCTVRKARSRETRAGPVHACVQTPRSANRPPHLLRGGWGQHGEEEKPGLLGSTRWESKTKDMQVCAGATPVFKRSFLSGKTPSMVVPPQDQDGGGGKKGKDRHLCWYPPEVVPMRLSGNLGGHAQGVCYVPTRAVIPAASKWARFLCPFSRQGHCGARRGHCLSCWSSRAAATLPGFLWILSFLNYRTQINTYF